MPKVEEKTWHFASGTSCAAANFYSIHLLAFLPLPLLPFVNSEYISFVQFLQTHHLLSVFVGRAVKNNLVLVFPQIRRWEEWSPARRALAQWLCWHGPKLNTPHPFSQGPGSVIHYQQNPTSHSSQTFTPLLPPPMAGMPPEKGIGVTCVWLFPSPLLFPAFPRVF